jgi:ADP-heptose:LPS heptosyltransferase
METIQRILLIRLKSIGDVVLTLPAVNAVRDNFPTAEITYLASLENAPLLRGFRAVNHVIPLDRAALRSGNPLKVLPEFFGLLRRIRAGKFDLAVDFQGFGETAWLTRFTGAPNRWGSVYGRGRAWAYTRGVTRDDRIHHVDWYLSFLQQCGLRSGKIRNEYFLPEEALVAAQKFLAAYNLDATKPVLFIQPFTSSPQKNWPLDRYMAVARHGQEHGWQILFGGGPADRAVLESARESGFPVSAGVPMLVTGGLMKLSSLVLGGDTGALHLAVAMGRRVVMIGETSGTGKTNPYYHTDWTITPPAGQTLSNIETDRVIKACSHALDELSRTGAG